MNSPTIWIGFPAIVALVLWLIKKNERVTLIVGLVASLILAITASVVPVGKTLFTIGNSVVQISQSIGILGRSFTLSNGDLIFASFLFVILFLFFSMAFIIEIPERFLPLSFLLTSIILAALSVQPFLYAALLLEIGVLLSIILISPDGEVPTPGVVRFLIYQSIAMPIMLTAGWVLSAVEANPTDVLILQALGLIGLGFAFWLAVFPFNFWMPQLSGEKSPFLVGFVLILFNTAILILIMRYLDGFVWLRDDSRIFIVLRLLGILVLFSSGLFFLMENNINKSLAYLISFETGFALLALSLNTISGWNIFVILFIPRILTLSVWTAGLSYFDQRNESFSLGRKRLTHPAVLSAFWVSGLSILGFPFLPGFVSQWHLLSSIASQNFISFTWIIISLGIFVIACIRFISRLNNSAIPEDLPPLVSNVEKIYFYIAIGLLALIGTFPQLFINQVLKMLLAYPNLK